jgi:NADP-dependent 3-hydroxy acid dehydrogenase YdfG
MTGKVLFITGASTGIGEATALAASEAGWRLGLMARSGDKLEAIVDRLGGPDAALALPGDATDLSQQQKAMAALAEAYGGIDAAFANAGRGASAAGTEQGDPEDWQGMVELNILGMLYTAKAALPHLRPRKGHFVVTGSAAGRRHLKGSIYGATKWFVHGFGGNLAEEMADWGGRCTVVAPGMVDTPFFDEAKPDKLHPEDVAAAVMLALDAPARCAVREVFLMPTA